MTADAPPAAAALAYRAMTVAAVTRLTPRSVRVTFTGGDLRDLPAAAPDAYLKLFFPLPGQPRPVLPPPVADEATSWYRTYLAMPDDERPPMRTYTLRAHRPDRAEADIDFVLHDDAGPGSRWAETARPGDEVAFLGPHGLYAPAGGPGWQLLVGDESALPAIGAILETLPPGERARVFVEVAAADEELPLACPAETEISWVHRGTSAPGEAVLDAVRAARWPEGCRYAWISGEANLVKLARRHLVLDRGLDKRAITFTGYWRRGRSEEDTGRENVRRIDAGETLIEDEESAALAG